MSQYIIPNPNIPRTGDAKIVIQSFGLGVVKTDIYKAGMPAFAGTGKSYGVSKMGTPIFSNLDVSAFSYTDNFGNAVNVPAIKFETVLFVVSQSKNIQITNIQGRNSSVKEYIADNDYQVSIQGVLTGSNRQFPMQDSQDLIALLKAPIAFRVNSWYLDLFGINNIVVESYELGQDEGGYCYQKFSLNCLSDLPIELQITR